MTIAIFLLVPVLTIGAFFVGHRAGVKAGRFDAQFQKQHADDLFRSCDLELNALKVKHGQTLMELEDALRVAGKHILR